MAYSSSHKPGKDKPKKLPDPLNYSVWLLNYRSRSVKEMKEALLKKGFSDDIAEETVAKLISYGYLDDEKYREYMVSRRKHNNPKGRAFVCRELKTAGVDCGADMEELYTDEEEREIIANLVNKWQRSSKATLPENKNRFYNRLYSRGFASKNVSAVFEELLADYCEYRSEYEEFWE